MIEYKPNIAKNVLIHKLKRYIYASYSVSFSFVFWEWYCVCL